MAYPTQDLNRAFETRRISTGILGSEKIAESIHLFRSEHPAAHELKILFGR
jgi:hypothetical protein